MWTSVSGAAAQAQAVDTVANNLANVDTNGFKKDVPAFKEYLSSVERENSRPDIHIGPVKDKDLNPLYDKDQSHVIVHGNYTSFSQGPMKVTKAPLDVAIEGPGLIEVASPQGPKFTRHGSFKVAVDGRLVTNEGYPVLMAKAGGLAGEAPAALTAAGAATGDASSPIPGSLSDPSVASRFINLKDRGNIQINDKGEVYSGTELIGQIGLVEFSEPKLLQKTGLQYFTNTLPEKNAVVEASHSKIHQGMLEGSNVNPVEEMSNLIKANRLFEHDLKVMKTFGDLMGREANDIGKL
ncbi:MAG: flagellar hook-basal body protein [Bdellovibrionales bacterium]|nr:flagellar hook-basal body protein [Bdellovibrionales bacterium]